MWSLVVGSYINQFLNTKSSIFITKKFMKINFYILQLLWLDQLFPLTPSNSNMCNIL